jgi:hypothetical protein
MLKKKAECRKSASTIFSGLKLSRIVDDLPYLWGFRGNIRDMHDYKSRMYVVVKVYCMYVRTCRAFTPAGASGSNESLSTFLLND